MNTRTLIGSLTSVAWTVLMPAAHAQVGPQAVAQVEQAIVGVVQSGTPSGADGLAVDAEGRVYVAANAGIQVFSPQGQGLGVIPLPKRPQNIAFAGPDKKTLYAVGRGAVYRLTALTPGVSGRAK